MLVAAVVAVTYFSIITQIESWDPDAGLVKSFTKLPGVTVSATSGNSSAYKVLDNKDNTQWSSENCLPMGYLNQPIVNQLLWLCNTSCITASTLDSNISRITDGSLYTNYRVQTTANNNAILTLSVAALTFSSFSVWGIYEGDTTITFLDSNDNVIISKTLTSQNNYQEERISVGNNVISKIILESTSSFLIKEVSAFGSRGCIERVVVDLGTRKIIGNVRTRHWAGNNAAQTVTLRLSADGQTWPYSKSLFPNALQAVDTRIDPPASYRYIAIEYEMHLRNYLKVYCWEIDAWDEHTIWGPPVPAKPNRVSLRQLLGVNGIWGWGHGTYSEQIPPGDGPMLYTKIASHARNYHNLNWDVSDPDNDPHFNTMDTTGTDASWWLNWDKEYKVWVNANLSVDASIQFLSKTFPPSRWDHPVASAFRYGREFAKHFGPETGTGNVTAMEVGNEPWDYSADFYDMILQAMAAGVRSVDKTIHVLPGAFQAHELSSTEPTSGNYIGTRVREAASRNISVINTHAYSFMINEKGVRIGTYPEHVDSSFNAIRNIMRWRDTNTPKMPVWLTEWGWDANGENENCTNSECVSDLAQAIYGVRGLFIASRYGIERATWYFYANTENCETLFCRSGLTTSKENNFTKKIVFYAFEAVLQTIGELHFLDTLKEDGAGYVYLYGSKHIHSRAADVFLKASHIVAWLPVAAEEVMSVNLTVTIPSELSPINAWRLTGQRNPAIENIGVPSKIGNTLNLHLSAIPIIIQIAPASFTVVG